MIFTRLATLILIAALIGLAVGITADDIKLRHHITKADCVLIEK